MDWMMQIDGCIYIRTSYHSVEVKMRRGKLFLFSTRARRQGRNYNSMTHTIARHRRRLFFVFIYFDLFLFAGSFSPKINKVNLWDERESIVRYFLLRKIFCNEFYWQLCVRLRIFDVRERKLSQWGCEPTEHCNIIIYKISFRSVRTIIA